MVETVYLGGKLRGCLNPVCPRANWHEPHIPTWSVRREGGELVEFGACDEACARAAARFIHTRLKMAEEVARPHDGRVSRRGRPALTPQRNGTLPRSNLLAD